MKNIPEELLPSEGAGRDELKTLYLMDVHEAIDRDVIFRWTEAQALYNVGMEYLKTGDSGLVLNALSKCCLRSLPIPKWCELAFLNDCYRKIYWDMVDNSWDSVFGKPFKKGTQLGARKEFYDKSFLVYQHIKKLKADNPATPIDEKLFDEVGRELAVGGKTKVGEMYYFWKNYLEDIDGGVLYSEK